MKEEKGAKGAYLQGRRIVKEQICEGAADGEIVPSQSHAPSNRNRIAEAIDLKKQFKILLN